MQNQQIDAIDFHHVPDDVRQIVRDWYAGRAAAVALDGTRSVHLTHPSQSSRTIKLKGAGVSGGPVRFGVLYKSGPRAPVFDFDGRMMDDVASGHDGAPDGGCSFQQAATEYHVTRQLAAAGLPVVPCLGYGRVEKNGLASWFSVFDLEPGTSGETTYPAISRELWMELNAAIGHTILDLAVTHDLVGQCWYAITPDGGRLLRDLHPFRQADPINMSQVSWVMQVFFALHIRSNAHRLRARTWQDGRMPPDLHVWPFRAVCPEATIADHDVLREQLVAPYMLKPPARFSPERLIALLRANPITSALMDVCPRRFARV